eukprot:403336844
MGNYNIKAQKKILQDYKDGLEVNKMRYQKIEKRRVLLFGPSQSGKTQMMNALTDLEFDEKYEQTTRVQLGLKLINPREGVQNPVSYRFVDCPGQYLHYQKASMYAFEKPDIILILIDGSIRLDEQEIRNWVFTTMQQIYKYHRYRSQAPSLTPVLSPQDDMVFEGGEQSPRSQNSITPNPNYVTGQVINHQDQTFQNQTPDHSRRPSFSNINISTRGMLADQNILQPSNNDHIQHIPTQNTNNIMMGQQMNTGVQFYPGQTVLGGVAMGETGQFQMDGYMPEIVHVFTKRDLISYDGYQKQLKTIEMLQEEGIIDQFFFVSSLSKYGVNDLKKYLNEFQVPVMQQAQSDSSQKFNK